jgi:hypothetical protein
MIVKAAEERTLPMPWPRESGLTAFTRPTIKASVSVSTQFFGFGIHSKPEQEQIL